jgi:hypothetical protein
MIVCAYGIDEILFCLLLSPLYFLTCGPLSSFHLNTPVSLTDVKITRNDVSTSHNINLLPYLTFTAPARGQFGGEDNVSRNDIEELKSPTEPQFLRDLRSKLRQRRWITSTTVRFSFIIAFLVTTAV